jgi:hypothetical protein
MVTKYESRVNPRTGKASLIKVEKPLTRQQQAMKIQREQRAAAPKPKGTLLSATTGGVERKVEAGKIVPEKSTLLQAPAFAEPEAVTVEAQPETKGMSKEALAIQKAFDEGRITQEAYGRAMQALSERGVVTTEEYKQVTAKIKDEPAREAITVEPVADEVEIPVIGEEFLTPEAINLAITGRESGIAEEGFVFDLTSPTGFREEETGQVVPQITAAPLTVTESTRERAKREKELSVIRQERDLLVDAAIQDMLTTGRLQTRGQAATVQFLRRPGSRQLAEDLLGFYGLFI